MKKNLFWILIAVALIFFLFAAVILSKFLNLIFVMIVLGIITALITLIVFLMKL